MARALRTKYIFGYTECIVSKEKKIYMLVVTISQLRNARFSDFLNRFRKRKHDQDKFGDSATRCVAKDSEVN